MINLIRDVVNKVVEYLSKIWFLCMEYLFMKFFSLEVFLVRDRVIGENKFKNKKKKEK